jgi:hypothetical protein
MVAHIISVNFNSSVLLSHLTQRKAAFLTGYSLCGLVVRVPGYRSRGPGSIPGAAKLSEK